MSRKTVELRRKFRQTGYSSEAADILLPLRDVRGKGKMTQIVSREIDATEDDEARVVLHRRKGIAGSHVTTRMNPEKEQRWRNVLKIK